MNRIETAKQLLSDAPYFSLGALNNDILYRRFNELKETLHERGEQDTHNLNHIFVTGVWYLSGLNFGEGNPQVIIRTSIQKGTFQRILLGAELHEFIFQDCTYDYNADVIGADGMIIGQQEELLTEIEEGRVLTIFDKERDK